MDWEYLIDGRYGEDLVNAGAGFVDGAGSAATLGFYEGNDFGEMVGADVNSQAYAIGNIAGNVTGGAMLSLAGGAGASRLASTFSKLDKVGDALDLGRAVASGDPLSIAMAGVPGGRGGRKGSDALSGAQRSANSLSDVSVASQQSVGKLKKAYYTAKNFRTIRKLKRGQDVAFGIDKGGLNKTFKRMSEITAATGNEVAALRTIRHGDVLRMGQARGVSPKGSTYIFGHTHPSGNLSFSSADRRVLRRMGQKHSAVVTGDGSGDYRWLSVR